MHEIKMGRVEIYLFFFLPVLNWSWRVLFILIVSRKLSVGEIGGIPLRYGLCSVK